MTISMDAYDKVANRRRPDLTTDQFFDQVLPTMSFDEASELLAELMEESHGGNHVDAGPLKDDLLADLPRGARVPLDQLTPAVPGGGEDMQEETEDAEKQK